MENVNSLVQVLKENTAGKFYTIELFGEGLAFEGRRSWASKGTCKALITRELKHNPAYREWFKESDSSRVVKELIDCGIIKIVEI